MIAHLKKVHTSRIRANFLGKCIQHKLTPPTLAVRPPKSEACQNAQLSKQYQNAACSASQSYVKIAFSDAKRHAKEEKVRYEKSYAAQMSNLIESDKKKLTTHINQREPQMINQIHHKYRQKFNHLNDKHGRTQEVNPSQVPGLTGTTGITSQEPKKSTRRFIKRNK